VQSSVANEAIASRDLPQSHPQVLPAVHERELSSIATGEFSRMSHSAENEHLDPRYDKAKFPRRALG